MKLTRAIFLALAFLIPSVSTMAQEPAKKDDTTEGAKPDKAEGKKAKKSKAKKKEGDADKKDEGTKAP
jgi:hypothetical protein